MSYQIRIDTDEAIRQANELSTLADNYAKLSEQFLSEMADLSGTWEGMDATEFMNQTLNLSEDLRHMSNRFLYLSEIIRVSVNTYLNRIEDNISVIRNRFQ